MNESSIVVITDNRGTIQFVNKKLCHISKYGREDLIGSPQSIVSSGYHSETFFKELWKMIESGN